jgi:hypothetical protein
MHPFVYKACIAVLERTAARIEDTRQYYAEVARVQEFEYSCVEPLVAHAEADEEFAHLDSLTEFSKMFSVLHRDVVESALREARAFVSTLNLWQASIANEYGMLPLGSFPYRRYRE